MVAPQDYEQMLNWFYDRSKEGDIALKATCAPHYFRVVRQRRAQERREAVAATAEKLGKDEIGPADMMMPGSTGVVLTTNALGGHRTGGHPGGHPDSMNAMTKGCLAGTGVCFISHQGEVYPCGNLPVIAGDLNKQSFAEIWEKSTVFNELRDTENLKGKCGCCEFRNVCMGCRARAFAATGDYLDEEPFCVYEPRSAELKARKAAQG
jgi:radical SAM protein with 4Fe4S-binding SPASM domain